MLPSPANSAPIADGRYPFAIQVNHDKAYVVAEGGITLHDLHAGLAANDLCMINCGSISDQVSHRSPLGSRSCGFN